VLTRCILQELVSNLLWAGAAIGFSHLVQSTQEGAIYNFSRYNIDIHIHLNFTYLIYILIIRALICFYNYVVITKTN